MLSKIQKSRKFNLGKVFSTFLLLISFLFSETGLPSTNAFTSASQLGLGGAGFLNPNSISSKLNPAMNDSSRDFAASIIRYPANILSQSVGVSFPTKKGFVSGSIRHLNYGTFEGYDTDFNSTGSYQSSETWMGGTYSRSMKTMPLQVGIGSQFFNSSYKDSKIRAISFSVGGEYYLHRIQTSLGLSFHQLGWTWGKDAESSLVRKTILSGSKKLAHLPLTLFTDAIFSDETETPEVFLGGRFNLKNKLQISWGTSSRKMDHNINQDLARTVLGATGIGVGFSADDITIHYSSFILGTGATIQGVEIGVQF